MRTLAHAGVALAAAALTLTGCADPTADPGPPGVLRSEPTGHTVTVHTTLEGPRTHYFEGASSEVSLVSKTERRVHLPNEGPFPSPPGWSQSWDDVPAGRYHLTAAVRPCDGNCENLDPPTDSCRRGVDLNADTEVLVTFHYGQPCKISLLQDDQSVPRRLDCPGDAVVSTDGGLLDADATLHGDETPGKAVEAFLPAIGLSGHRFVVDVPEAWVLRPDGTAVARLDFLIDDGWTVHGYDRCIRSGPPMPAR